MEGLPIDCVTSILSFCSPADVAKFSIVSPASQLAAQSDVVWEKFLPPNYSNILPRLDTPLVCGTKKELFMRLCDPLLMDHGKKSFRLEKATGKISYVLSARELSITWSHDPSFWCWKFSRESRFPEAVELRSLNWLEIEGRISCKVLSPNTLYGAYLILNVSKRAYGLDILPSITSIEIGNRSCTCRAYISHQHREKHNIIEEDNVRVPCQRVDGWLEIELGEFFNGEGNEEEVKMSLKEVNDYHLKAGLIVEGIEVRPKHLK